MYVGWEIYAHKGKITKNKQPIIKNKLKKLFSSNGWLFFENTHESVIHHQLNQYNIIVIFQETEFTAEEDVKDIETYGLVFKSEYLGYKHGYSHKKLYSEVFRRIPWKKQGFWLEDGSRIPIPKTRTLRIRI